MQVEHKTEKGTVLFVKVPIDTVDFEIATIKNSKYLIFGDVSYSFRLKEQIPYFDWQLIGLTSEVTEEKAKMMGFEPMINILDWPANTDLPNTIEVSGLDQFKSLMQHLQVYEVNPYQRPIIVENEDNVMAINLYNQWQSAEEKTGKWIVLFKPS
jgi:hypothetical protein